MPDEVTACHLGIVNTVIALILTVKIVRTGSVHGVHSSQYVDKLNISFFHFRQKHMDKLC